MNKNKIFMDDYSKYQNSTMLIDKSGLQPLMYSMCFNGLNIYDFLLKNNITLAITETSIKEFTHQTYNQHLFAGDYAIGNTSAISAAVVGKNDFYVLSRVNGSLTTASLDSDGYLVNIISAENFSTTYSLWNNTRCWVQLSEQDKSIVYSARYLANFNGNFFVLVNDEKLVEQLKIESFNFIRNSSFLGWMVKDNYISYQKGTYVYHEWQVYNPRWTNKSATFSDVLH